MDTHSLGNTHLALQRHTSLVGLDREKQDVLDVGGVFLSFVYHHTVKKRFVSHLLGVQIGEIRWPLSTSLSKEIGSAIRKSLGFFF